MTKPEPGPVRFRPVVRHADPQPPRREDIVQLDGNAKRAIDIGRTRLVVAGALFIVVYLVIVARLVSVTLLGGGEEPRVAGTPAQPTQVERGEILDRNGVVLATNLATASLYANPQQVSNADETATRLAEVLPGLDVEEVRAKLKRSDRSFFWIRRNLTPRQEYAVNRLGIPGLYFQREERRVYPQGGLTGHVIGFTDVDNRGLAGIEQSFDGILREGRRPITLSLDLRIQNIVHEELARAVQEFSAIGGAGIVMDIQTGEVLAMVSLPDFDPNLPGAAPDDARFNRATLGVYEMGSVFKIFNTAMVLDGGVAHITDSFDASKPIRVGGFTIHDYHAKNRWLTIPEIFMYSSNIGSAKMAAEAGTPRQQDFMMRLGMLQPVKLELPDLGKPLYPIDWKPINTMTIAYGHGLAVTPLHLISGLAAVIDGGVFRPMTLLKRASSEPTAGKRVVSEETSVEMRKLLRLVVQAGTGRMADAPGYLVGGKTGTADKQHGRGYSAHSNLASFAGAFPMNAPRYAVLLMVDEPKPNAQSHGYATAGWVAAPAVGRLVQRMAPLVGLEPIPDTAPEAQNDLFVAVSAAD
jgi:cell division protein FtsI (penicillin-binding protein 3)